MAMRTFGQLLREERKNRHWSQAQLAEKVNTDVKTISRWETGSTFPPPHYQERLYAVLGKDLLADLDQKTPLLSSHVPARNPFFIGRDELLEQIHTLLSEGKATVALSGLGGIGKTHIVAEYAYRHQEDYQCLLWAAADSQSALALACRQIAEMLNLPVTHEQDQKHLMDMVKQWLHEHRGWLLILDNVEDPQSCR